MQDRTGQQAVREASALSCAAMPGAWEGGSMLTEEISDCAGRATLCWLATVDATGHPNVSPKEVFAVFDTRHLVIAHIASPTSVRNIRSHERVCVSFIDIFVQKGWKVSGSARLLGRDDAGYARWVAPLTPMAGPRFTIHGVIVVQAHAVEPIIAPSYRLYPQETTEASQVAAALRAYRVEPGVGFRSAGPAQRQEFAGRLGDPARPCTPPAPADWI